MSHDTGSLGDAVKALLLLIDEGGETSDDSGDNSSNDGEDSDNGDEVKPGENEPVEMSWPDFGDTPVGVSVFRVSNSLSAPEPDPDPFRLSDENISDRGDGRSADAPAQPSASSIEQYLFSGTADLGAQLLNGGVIRSSYQGVVADLESSDVIQRTVTKAINRALTPPIARAYLNLARPISDLPASAAVTDEFWLNSYFSGALDGRSANVSNTPWNQGGAISRWLGSALLLADVGIGIQNVITSDDPARKSVTEFGRLSGSIMGGYLGGYLVGEPIALAFATVGIAGAAPFVTAGGAVLGSILLAKYGATTAEIVAADIYNAIQTKRP